MRPIPFRDVLFFFIDTATTEIYTLSLHDALPISLPTGRPRGCRPGPAAAAPAAMAPRSEEHTSKLQSQFHLVCRLLLEKKKKKEKKSLSKKKKKKKKNTTNQN